MFKVGDRVRIIEKPPADRYTGPGWSPLMDVFCGQIGEVEQVEDNGCLRIYRWWFHRSWVTPEKPVGSPRDQAILTWQQTEQNMKARRDEILRKMFGG